MKIIKFSNDEKFITQSVDFILEQALVNVAQKGFFTISLTGGTTPVKIYQTLASEPYIESFPWENTFFFLGDERILTKKDYQSNIFMINQSLFSRVSIPDKNKILPKLALKNPEEIAKDYEIKVKNFFKENKPSFDLLLLGMGLDCHTASLFPIDDNWRNSANYVISTSIPVGTPKVYRISMSLQLINQSKNILMLISGENKKEVANELLKDISVGKNPTMSPIPEIKNIGEFVWHIN